MKAILAVILISADRAKIIAFVTAVCLIFFIGPFVTGFIVSFFGAHDVPSTSERVLLSTSSDGGPSGSSSSSRQTPRPTATTEQAAPSATSAIIITATLSNTTVERVTPSASTAEKETPSNTTAETAVVLITTTLSEITNPTTTRKPTEPNTEITIEANATTPWTAKSTNSRMPTTKPSTETATTTNVSKPTTTPTAMATTAATTAEATTKRTATPRMQIAKKPIFCTTRQELIKGPADGVCEIIFYESFYVERHGSFLDTSPDKFVSFLKYAEVNTGSTQYGIAIEHSKELDAFKHLNTTAGIDAFEKIWTKNIRHYGLLNLPVHDAMVTSVETFVNYNLLLKRLRFLQEEHRAGAGSKTGYLVLGIALYAPQKGKVHDYLNGLLKFQFNAIYLQTVTGPQLQFYDVVVSWPGSVLDSRIFDNSRVRVLYEERRVPGTLLRDMGYACFFFLMAPLADPGPVNTPRGRNELIDAVIFRTHFDVNLRGNECFITGPSVYVRPSYDYEVSVVDALDYAQNRLSQFAGRSLALSFSLALFWIDPVGGSDQTRFDIGKRCTRIKSYAMSALCPSSAAYKFDLIPDVCVMRAIDPPLNSAVMYESNETISWKICSSTKKYPTLHLGVALFGLEFEDKKGYCANERIMSYAVGYWRVDTVSLYMKNVIRDPSFQIKTKKC